MFKFVNKIFSSSSKSSNTTFLNAYITLSKFSSLQPNIISFLCIELIYLELSEILLICFGLKVISSWFCISPQFNLAFYYISSSSKLFTSEFYFSIIIFSSFPILIGGALLPGLIKGDAFKISPISSSQLILKSSRF